MKTILVKLSPILAEEVYGHTVDTGLYDYRNGNTTLRPEDVTLYEKLEKNHREVEVTEAEAGSLYDELYNLIDFFSEWAEQEGVKWLSVRKAAIRQMAKLKEFGVKTDERGWAKR